MQVPSGRFAETYGAKWVIATSLLGTGIINLLTPIATESVPAFMASRAVLGVVQGGLFPGTPQYCVIAELPQLSFLKHVLQ